MFLRFVFNFNKIFIFYLSDEDQGDLQKLQGDNKNLQQTTGQLGQNPFLDIPEAANAVEYKKGYVMRKCCYDVNYKKSKNYLNFNQTLKTNIVSKSFICCVYYFLAPFGKRSWKMFYCTLRDLVLYLHKDEHGFRKSQVSLLFTICFKNFKKKILI